MVVPTIGEMIISLNRDLPYLETLARSASYVMGMLFIMRGLYKLKVYGEMRTMMSSNASITGPLMLLISGGIFLYLPGAFQQTLLTFFSTATPSPLDYMPDKNEEYNLLLTAVVNTVRLIGIVAFLKGWMILSKAGEQQGAQQGGVGKGLTHVLGGILAVNIVGTMHVLASTFSIG